MRSDLARLIWLRARLERGRLRFWVAAGGADIDSESFAERMYILYLGLIVVGSLVLAVAAVASSATKFGAGMTPGMRLLFRNFVLLAPCSLIAAFGKRTLKSSPVKFTSPDIAYVGASALDLRAIALSSCLRELVPVVLVAPVVGYLVGKVAVGMGAPSRASLVAAAFAVLIATAILLLAWIAGLVRVRLGHRPWHRWSWIAAPVAASAIALLPPAFRWPGSAFYAALEGRAVTWHLLGLLLVIGVAFWLLLAVSVRMDMIAVIEETALYAELYVLSPLKLFNSAAYNQIMRRKRLAAKGPRWHLPKGSGAYALISRALVSHRRQPSTLTYPFIWGLGILPYIAVQAMHLHEFSAYFPSIFLFVVGPSSDLLHVFKQDTERPSLREYLPFGNLRLLLLDSVPVLGIIAVGSVVVMGMLGGRVEERIIGGLLCVLLALIVLFCRGLERLKPPGVRSISHNVSAAVSIGAVLLAGSFGSPIAACLTALAIAVLLGMMIRFAKEAFA